MKSDVEYINGFIDQYVGKAVRLSEEQRLKPESGKETGRYIFLNELAWSGYDEKKMRVELLSILFAGRDTIASLLSILWYNLSRRPDIVRELREEISYLGGRPPSLEELKELKYLKWTINESKHTLCRRLDLGTDCDSSTAPLSYRTSKWSKRTGRHGASTWRRSRWEVSSFCASWHLCVVLHLFYASAKRSFWGGCRGIQTGEMGISESRVGCVSTPDIYEPLS
jgi:hypothetical protein